MKKIALFLMVALLISLFAGCNSTTDSTTSPVTNANPATTAGKPNPTPPTTAGTPEPTIPTTTAPNVEQICEGITLVSCRFTEEVTAQDKELIQSSYGDRENKIFVDMVFYVSPDYMQVNGHAPYFSAHLDYNGEIYTLQYDCEYENNTGFDKRAVAATGGFVHMFVLLPDAAQELAGSLEVQYTIDDASYSCVVGEKIQADPLANKTELQVGFRDSIFDGNAEFEVVDIRCAKYLAATNVGSSDHYYRGLGSPIYVDIILKITNNFESETLPTPTGYSIAGAEMTWCNEKMEINGNTQLDDASNIGPGQTQYIHVFSSVDKASKELGMRINYGGKLYYCTVPNTLYVEHITVCAYVPETVGTPSCWAWKDGGDNVFSYWPGESMDKDGSHYEISIPAWSDRVIINWSDGSFQTADIAIEAGRNVWIVIHPNSTDYTLFYEQPTQAELAQLGY